MTPHEAVEILSFHQHRNCRRWLAVETTAYEGGFVTSRKLSIRNTPMGASEGESITLEPDEAIAIAQHLKNEASLTAEAYEQWKAENPEALSGALS